MKAIAILAAGAALVTLAGCNKLGIGGGNANNSANSAAANSSAPQPGDGAANTQSAGAGTGGKIDEGGAVPATSNSGPIQLDRTFMMGRWTDNNDCSNVIEFTQDGRFIAANGGEGLWNLEGDRLTMTGRETATIRISPIDQNTITVINADGSLGRSTRC